MHNAADHTGSDRWLHKLALAMLIYNGVLADVFDYNYAPHLVLPERHCVWGNVLQEGCSYVELMQEEGLISVLLVFSWFHRSVVLYQVSDTGHEALGRMAQWDKEASNAFTHRTDSRKLLTWIDESYRLVIKSG